MEWWTGWERRRRARHHVMAGEETAFTANMANSHKNPSGDKRTEIWGALLNHYFFWNPLSFLSFINQLKISFLWSQMTQKCGSFSFLLPKSFTGVSMLLVCCFVLSISQSNKPLLLNLDLNLYLKCTWSIFHFWKVKFLMMISYIVIIDL